MTGTFNINLPSVALSKEESLIFKFVLKTTSTNNFTASISEGSLNVSSLAASTGYNSTTCFYFNTASISASAENTSSNDEIVFSSGISDFYDRNYLFVPNPLTGSQNSLYDIYGDVDYIFKIKPFDIVVTYLSDNTYVESRILDAYESGSFFTIKLDSQLSTLYRKNLISGSYQRFLLLSRVPDETNAHITYRKRPGPTSYGFSIPSNLHPDVLDNIDTITREVKQKLIELGGVDGGVL